LALFTAMLLWASSFVAMKVALTAVWPPVVMFLRMSLAFSLFLVLFAGSTRRNGFSYRKGDRQYLLFMVLCEPCFYFLFETYALKYTTASQAGMITSTLPLMTAFLAWMFLSERLSVRSLTGLVLAMSGVAWLSLTGRSTQTAPDPLLGNILETLAMLCAAGYMITLKHLSARYPTLLLTGLQILAGSLFFLPPIFFPKAFEASDFSPVAVLCIAYLGVFVTFGAYALYNYGVSKRPVGQASACLNLIPVFAIFFGWAILGEKFAPIQYIGVFLVFAGVLISQKRIRQIRETKEYLLSAR